LAKLAIIRVLGLGTAGVKAIAHTEDWGTPVSIVPCSSQTVIRKVVGKGKGVRGKGKKNALIRRLG
jgi:hypothetical protein